MSEVLIAGGTVTRVLAINGTSTMAGFGSSPVTSDLLAMRSHGGSADVVASTSSQAYAINDPGRIVGFATGISSGSAGPFMSPGVTSEAEIIGPLGVAFSINNRKQIVGQASIGGIAKAFLYSPDTPFAISDFGFAGGPGSSAGHFSVAYDVNDK